MSLVFAAHADPSIIVERIAAARMLGLFEAIARKRDAEKRLKSLVADVAKTPGLRKKKPKEDNFRPTQTTVTTALVV